MIWVLYKLRHGEMIFVVFVLPISVVVEGAQRAISSAHRKYFQRRT